MPYMPWVVLAACTLMLIGWSALSLVEVPYFGLGNYDDPLRGPTRPRKVSRVFPGSPASHAGLQPGDSILSVDHPSGQGLTSILYSRPRPGSESGLTVSVARNSSAGEQLLHATLSPEEPPPIVTLARYEPLAVALVYWVVGLLTWILQPFRTVARIFLLVCQFTAGLLAAGALSSLYMHLPASPYLFRLFLVASAPVSFHFCAIFPNPLPHKLLRPLVWSVYAGGIVVLVATILVPMALSIDVADAPLQLVQRLYVAVVLLSLPVLLLRRQRRAPLNVTTESSQKSLPADSASTEYEGPSDAPSEIRSRRRLLILGLAVSTLPMLALSLVPETLSGTPLLDYVWTFPALVLTPLSVGLAVKSGEMGKIDRLLNRSLVYALLVTLLLGLYIFFFSTLDLFPSQTWSRPLLAGLLAFAAIVLYDPARLLLQRLVDRLFYGGWYSYHKVVREASTELSRALDLQELIQRLMSIVRTMRFEAATLLWPQDGYFSPRGSLGNAMDALGGWRIPAGGALALHLALQQHSYQQEQLRVDLTDRMEELTSGERILLESDAIRFWLPLMSRGTLRAMLLLGDRQGEAMLSEEDLNILAPLAGQAGVAAENVSLLESLKARLVEVEQVRNALAEAHHRLVETQEVGQLRLARELHDSAVQQLLGISYQLAQQTWPGGEVASAELKEVKTSGMPPVTPELLRHEILGVVSQLRAMIGELRPAGLEHFGLTTALEGYVSRLEREGLWAGDREGMPNIEADFPPSEPDLPGPVALTLFRVAQEALRNALKHAAAHEIRLLFAIEDEEAIITVADDGRGFAVPVHLSDLAKGNHFGLIGMSERVEWAGGKLSIHSQAGHGTQVTVRIPLTGRQ